MHAVILIGLQASGKSTFCKNRLFGTHIRINLDMLRTRSREEVLLAACLSAKQPFVIDNTNPTVESRANYIQRAKEAGFRVTGYYFASKLDACKQRNENRAPDQVVPVKGLLGTYARLELPRRSEGFDELYYVELSESSRDFLVSEWNDEL
jgi:predicted kinase